MLFLRQRRSAVSQFSLDKISVALQMGEESQIGEELLPASLRGSLFRCLWFKQQTVTIFFDSWSCVELVGCYINIHRLHNSFWHMTAVTCGIALEGASCQEAVAFGNPSSCLGKESKRLGSRDISEVEWGELDNWQVSMVFSEVLLEHLDKWIVESGWFEQWLDQNGTRNLDFKCHSLNLATEEGQQHKVF